MRTNPEAGASFAGMLIQDDEPLADLSQVILLFQNLSLFDKHLIHSKKFENVFLLFKLHELLMF